MINMENKQWMCTCLILKFLTEVIAKHRQDSITEPASALYNVTTDCAMNDKKFGDDYPELIDSLMNVLFNAGEYIECDRLLLISYITLGPTFDDVLDIPEQLAIRRLDYQFKLFSELVQSKLDTIKIRNKARLLSNIEVVKVCTTLTSKLYFEAIDEFIKLIDDCVFEKFVVFLDIDQSIIFVKEYIDLISIRSNISV